jgi:hypothetical protein
MSMIGSGIYSTTETREIVCVEMCWDCIDINKKCDAVFNIDFETDDRGNIEQEVNCKKCKHSYTFKEES